MPLHQDIDRASLKLDNLAFEFHVAGHLNTVFAGCYDHRNPDTSAELGVLVATGRKRLPSEYPNRCVPNGYPVGCLDV